MEKANKELIELFEADQEQKAGINDYLQAVLFIRDKVDQSTKVLKMEKEALGIAERELISAMNEAGLKNFKNDDGVSAIRRNVAYYNVLAVDKPDLFDWLRSKDAGDLIKETVHHGTLRSFLADYVEQGNWLPEFVSVHEDEALTIRGRK